MALRPCTLKQVPSGFDSRGMLRQRGRALSSPAPPTTSLDALAPAEADDADARERIRAATRAISSPLWASGFSFSDCSVLHDVPYDPDLPYLFFGEEVSMAARLFTHGYDFFSPPEAVVYHLWTRSHRPSFLAHAHAHAHATSSEQQSTSTAAAADNSARISALRAKSEQRIRTLLGVASEQPQDDGNDHHAALANGAAAAAPPSPCTSTSTSASVRFGLGTRRTLRQFEESIGVCFAERKVEHQEYPEVAFASDEVGDLLAQISDANNDTVVDTTSALGSANTRIAADAPSHPVDPTVARLAGNSNHAILALSLVKQYLST